MLFAPALIRKIGKIAKIGIIGFALGMLTCFAASCAPQMDSFTEQAQTKEDVRLSSRFTVRVENRAFQDARVYLAYEGHSPFRIGRVTAATTTEIKSILVHTRAALFIIKMDDGSEHAVGPIFIERGMDVRLVLNNSAAQDIAIPLWRSL